MFDIIYEISENLSLNMFLFISICTALYPMYLWNVWFKNASTNTPESKELPRKLNRSDQNDHSRCAEYATTKFLRIVNRPESKSRYNANIQPIFYDEEKFQKCMSSLEAKEVEREWSTRVLVENTPVGNVSMSYDAYKRAFVYTCDQSISYKYLNIVAMRYVIVYRCLDFFMDSTVLPDDYKHPFIEQIENEEKKEKEKQKEKQNKIGINFADAPFLKSKTKPKTPTKQTEDTKKTDKPVYKNVFRNQGKMYELDILQTPKPEIPKTVEVEMDLSVLENSNEGYAEFKKRMRESA